MKNFKLADQITSVPEKPYDITNFTEIAYANGCSFIFSEGIKYNKIRELIETLKNDFKVLRSFWAYTCVYSEGSVFIEVTDNGIKIAAASLDTLKNLLDKYTSFLNVPLEDNTHKIRIFYRDKYGQDNKITGLNLDQELILPELYPTIDINTLVEQFKDAREKLLILYGRPGTGKTTLIKHIIKKDLFRHIAYTKDIGNKSDDTSFWTQLKTDGYDVLLLDDVPPQYFSVSTEETRNPFMDNLLEHLDGVFCDTGKVILTTNSKIQSIDGALTRDGRCFDFIKLEFLNGDQALKIWTNVLNMPPQSFPFQEYKTVSQATLMRRYFEQKNPQTKSYRKGGKQKSVQEILTSEGITITHNEESFGFN